MVSYIVINNFSVSFGISGRSFYPSHNTLRLIDRFEKYVFFMERLIADFVQFSNAIANFYFCKVRFSWVFIRISFDVPTCNVPVSTRHSKVHMFADLEITMLAHLAINHDLPFNHQLKKSHSISNHCEWDFSDDLGLYKMSWIMNIYSERCSFSTFAVTSNTPIFKAHAA